MTSTHEQGPVARSIETKIQQLQPVSLAIINDSHKHAHHEAMRGQQPKSSETHFRLEIVSDAFQGKVSLGNLFGLTRFFFVDVTPTASLDL